MRVRLDYVLLVLILGGVLITALIMNDMRENVERPNIVGSGQVFTSASGIATERLIINGEVESLPAWKVRVDEAERAFHAGEGQ